MPADTTSLPEAAEQAAADVEQQLAKGDLVMAVCCLVAAGALALISIDVLRSGTRRRPEQEGDGDDNAPAT